MWISIFLKHIPIFSFQRVKIIENKINILSEQNKKLSVKLSEQSTEILELNNKIIYLESEKSIGSDCAVDFRNSHYAILANLISDFDYNCWLTIGKCTLSESLCLYNLPFFWDIMPHSYWLYLTSCLIETEQIDKADYIMKRYIQKFSFKDIDRYLLVSNYCHQHNLTSDKIFKASLVYNVILRNDNILKCILENKSVAIVGNGPSELGHGNGSLIDSHDIVIRFNNYKTEGFADDYGNKTDVWVRSSAGDDVIPRDNLTDYQAVIWEADYFHYPIHYDDLNILYSQAVSAEEKISNFDFDVHNEIRLSVGLNNPSSGFICVYYCLKKCNPRSVSIFGFSFLENEPAYVNSHYFSDRTFAEDSEKIWKHDMEMESSIIKYLLSQYSGISGANGA